MGRPISPAARAASRLLLGRHVVKARERDANTAAFDYGELPIFSSGPGVGETLKRPLDTAMGDIGEGDFALGGDTFGSAMSFVRELHLGPGHAGNAIG